MNPRKRDVAPLIESIQDNSPIVELTHTYYRYPARFSPKFANAAIQIFTDPGDIVYDPFMGGGTTLVEAMRLGRQGIGTDLNSLAVFIAKTKTNLLSSRDIGDLRHWLYTILPRLTLTRRSQRPRWWITEGYQKNLSGKTTWPIRKTLELALSRLDLLSNQRQKNFARALLLRTGQWAIDCRENHPSAAEFREQLLIFFDNMINGMVQLKTELNRHVTSGDSRLNIFRPRCLNVPAHEIPNRYPLAAPPKLILTSPPYPGVHVLYHRWQINGRKETPAPYWISNCLDGKGASFYTFGDRKRKNLETYFQSLRECYAALSTVAGKGTWLIQLVAFSAPNWQLPLFLEVLQECRFREVPYREALNSIDGRSWRNVPNRKFYADHKGQTPSSREVLLIHKLQ
jgi:hypothetical protein